MNKKKKKKKLVHVYATAGSTAVQGGLPVPTADPE
jgi:hypothetical protein